MYLATKFDITINQQDSFTYYQFRISEERKIAQSHQSFILGLIMYMELNLAQPL